MFRAGRSKKGGSAKRQQRTQHSASHVADPEYQMHVHYDENGVFYEDDVDHAAVARAASPRRNTLKPFPALIYGGLVVIGGYIAINAVFLQTGKHPAPLVISRENTQPLDSTLLAVTTQNLERRALVADVQNELRRLGVYPGSIDGQFGPATDRAVRAYQRQRGMRETGQVTEALLARLTMDFQSFSQQQPTSAERVGSIPVPRTSPSVLQEEAAPSVMHLASTATVTSATQQRIRKLQQTLADLGYGPLTIDGIPGGQTTSAISAFQRDNGLVVNGQISEALLLKLKQISGTSL